MVDSALPTCGPHPAYPAHPVISFLLILYFSILFPSCYFISFHPLFFHPVPILSPPCPHPVPILRMLYTPTSCNFISFHPCFYHRNTSTTRLVPTQCMKALTGNVLNYNMPINPEFATFRSSQMKDNNHVFTNAVFQKDGDGRIHRLHVDYGICDCGGIFQAIGIDKARHVQSAVDAQRGPSTTRSGSHSMTSLLVAMLPVYLLGNLHCIGMCGPLVMMLGKHNYRYWYFLGRFLSFTAAATLAGGIGAVTNAIFHEWYIGQAACFLFGTILIVLGVFTLMQWGLPIGQRLGKRLQQLNGRLSLFMLQDRAWPIFLFGLATVLLPCGQTLIVFSACALSGSPLVGMINGAAFSLLTTPSLALAMHAHGLLHRFRNHYNTIVGILAIVVGIFALLRGFAEIGYIPHLTIDINDAAGYHLIIY